MSTLQREGDGGRRLSGTSNRGREFEGSAKRGNQFGRRSNTHGFQFDERRREHGSNFSKVRNGLRRNGGNKSRQRNEHRGRFRNDGGRVGDICNCSSSSEGKSNGEFFRKSVAINRSQMAPGEVRTSKNEFLDKCGSPYGKCCGHCGRQTERRHGCCGGSYHNSNYNNSNFNGCSHGKHGRCDCHGRNCGCRGQQYGNYKSGTCPKCGGSTGTCPTCGGSTGSNASFAGNTGTCVNCGGSIKNCANCGRSTGKCAKCGYNGGSYANSGYNSSICSNCGLTVQGNCPKCGGYAGNSRKCRYCGRYVEEQPDSASKKVCRCGKRLIDLPGAEGSERNRRSTGRSESEMIVNPFFGRNPKSDIVWGAVNTARSECGLSSYPKECPSYGGAYGRFGWDMDSDGKRDTNLSNSGGKDFAKSIAQKESVVYLIVGNSVHKLDKLKKQQETRENRRYVSRAIGSSKVDERSIRKGNNVPLFKNRPDSSIDRNILADDEDDCDVNCYFVRKGDGREALCVEEGCGSDCAIVPSDEDIECSEICPKRGNNTKNFMRSSVRGSIGRRVTAAFNVKTDSVGGKRETCSLWQRRDSTMENGGKREYGMNSYKRENRVGGARRDTLDAGGRRESMHGVRRDSVNGIRREPINCPKKEAAIGTRRDSINSVRRENVLMTDRRDRRGVGERNIEKETGGPGEKRENAVKRDVKEDGGRGEKRENGKIVKRRETDDLGERRETGVFKTKKETGGGERKESGEDSEGSKSVKNGTGKQPGDAGESKRYWKSVMGKEHVEESESKKPSREYVEHTEGKKLVKNVTGKESTELEAKS